MYQSRFDAMTASLFFTPHASPTVAQPSLAQPSLAQAPGALCPLERPRRSLRPAAIAVESCASVLGMALVLMMVAALVAPEQPLQQGAICERHNGAAACRIW
jgi:hypothetical protein